MDHLRQYLNVRSAYGASLGPDGRLAFVLDATGVPQLYTLTEPGGWPRQRTFAGNRVTFATWSPERPELVFGRDDGGNERVQLFRLTRNGDAFPLTKHPDAKHRWGGWSHDGDRFAFASNRRDEAVFDIYVQGRTERGDDATRVHEGIGWLAAAGWSPSDDRLLVTESHSNFDQDLYVLDLDSGDLENVTPHGEGVRFKSASWGPDGEALYVRTDHEADTLWLGRLDLDTHELTPVVSEGEWNVSGFALDEETGRVVYAQNVDGYTELTVGSLTDQTEIEASPTPDLPAGIAGGVSFGPSAESFAITVSGREANPNVYVVDVRTGDSQRWTAASTARIPREQFRTPDLIHYETFDGREIPAFFTLPAEIPDDGCPVIVDIHGGPESQRRPSFSGIRQYFLAEGYALFEPNVRGSSGYGKAYSHLDDVEKRMDAVADVRAGVDWLDARADVDSEKIIAKGGSYGGFMVLASLAAYPDLWAAGVDIVGIANFVTFLENTGSWRRELREAEYGSLAEDRDLLESVSPVTNAEKIEAPLFVLHGANDPRVPVGEAEQIVDTVRNQGVPVETCIFEDEGHGITKRENRIEAYTRIVAFLDEHVGAR